jgi:protein-S-isoprenylcysteine O-methyltransferase Ste14
LIADNHQAYDNRRKEMLETEKAKPYEAARPTEIHTRTSHGSENLKPPRFLAWLASLAMVSLMLVNLFLQRGDNPYLRGAGVVVLVLASVFIFAPFFLLRKHGRIKDGETYMQTNTVVDQGLYAITRHPQYLGYMFFACGFALLSQHWVAVLLAAVAVPLFCLQAVKEEHYCLTQLGEPYEQYRRRVPRFNLILGIMRLPRGGRK